MKVILSLGFFMVDVAKGTPGLIGILPKTLGVSLVDGTSVAVPVPA